MSFFSDLFGGLFGGGGSSKAYDQAQADEARRRAEIEAAQKRIEAIFSSPERQKHYADYTAANRDLLFSELDRQKQTNDRQLKFALARSGLSGGSTDIDQNRLLAETYLRGIAQAEAKAQNAGAELRNSDQQAKQQLFSQLLAGADATTAVQNAGQMMRTNIALNQQDNAWGAFDKLFSGFGDIYKNSREAAGERRANYDFGSLFGPRPKSEGVKVAGGVYG